MSLKAKLSIVLKADDVVIAETQDAKLWLKMLTSIIESPGIESKGMDEAPGHAAQSKGPSGSEHHNQHDDQHPQSHDVSA